MINKYFDGEVSNKGVSEKIDNNLIKEAESLYIKVENYMNKLEVPKALDSIFDLFRSLNKYIDETTPWILAKDDSKKDRLATVLYNLIEVLELEQYYLDHLYLKQQKRYLSKLILIILLMTV